MGQPRELIKEFTGKHAWCNELFVNSEHIRGLCVITNPNLSKEQEEKFSKKTGFGRLRKYSYSCAGISRKFGIKSFAFENENKFVLIDRSTFGNTPNNNVVLLLRYVLGYSSSSAKDANLDTGLKDRVEKIKEYCSSELEFIQTQGCLRFYNRHGPSHSQRVWENLKKVLESGNGALSEYKLFLGEAAAWCHDLGMIKRKGENFDDPQVCEEVRKTHHERVLECIPKHWKELGLSNEPEAILLANICWAHSSKADLSKLKEKEQILVGENVEKVRTRFLGALLRHADALDAGKDRLPPENYRDHPEISESQLEEYWKHEVVDSVKIKGGDIILQMSVKHEYQVNVVEEVKKKLNDELESVKGVLDEYGLNLKFNFLVQSKV